MAQSEVEKYYFITTHGTTVDAEWTDRMDTMVTLNGGGGEEITVEIEDLYDVLTELRNRINDR